MKISMKSQTVLKTSQEKTQPIVQWPEKSQSLLVVSRFLCHKEASELQESLEIFFEIEINSCLAL